VKTPADPLTERLERWVRAGLISDEQAERIRAAERETAGPAADLSGPRQVSAVAEGLGYVGGVLVVVAAVTITGRYWTAIGVPGRVAIALGAAALLLAIGAAVPQASGAGRRLRAVSWTLSVAALAFGIELLAADGLGWHGENVSLLAGAVCAAYGGLLWSRRPGAMQQGVVLAALAVTAGSAAALLPAGTEPVIGLAVWGVGLVWLLLGWGGLIAPWPAVEVCGAIAAIVGALLTVAATWGGLPAVGTVVGLVTAGVVVRDIVLTVMGTLATLLIVPTVSERYFPDMLGPALTLLLAGILLVAAALYVARRGGRRVLTERRAGEPRLAAGLAAGVTVAVAALVVGLGVA
jgi:hypothetical protein